MKLLKPHWVSHDGNPIYSLSIHPDGTRVATGGQGKDSGIVIIWNVAPIRSETSEKDGNVPKILCELTNHLGCVNCVKWSTDGKWLASSGDDAIIMLWQLRYKGITAPAFGSDKPTHEQWGCGFMLRGHSGDVLDISWSNDQRFLASASVDNTIIVWNARKFPEKLASISDHTGLVKGLTWDPVGKYLASQSDDKSVRVWRTSDWKEEAKITAPFRNCGGTTHVLRLSWSPDGKFIVSAHSLNNDGPTAHIIDRNSWKTGMDFVGHRKAIEVVSFNPHLFTKSNSESDNHGCIAIGSRDRSLSVWLTSLKRPLVVVHDLFNSSILDLAWSKDGYTLMACSLDGTCAYLSFTEKEIGTCLEGEAIDDLFFDLYGTKRVTRDKLTDDLLLEDPAMLHVHQNCLDAPPLPLQPSKSDGVFSPSRSVSSVSSLSQQVESRTKDGRRRIIPITLTSQPSYLPMQSTPFSSPKVSTTPKKSEPTPQKNQSLLSTAMDAAPGEPNAKEDNEPPTQRSVKSPPQAHPISFAPLSPDHLKKEKGKDSKDRSLSAAKAIITGVKRRSSCSDDTVGHQSPNLAKSKRSKRIRLTDDFVPSAKPSSSQKPSSRILSSSSSLLPAPNVEPCLAAQITSPLINETCTTIEASNSPSGSTVSCVNDEGTTWTVSFSSAALVLSATHSVTCVGLEDSTAVFLSSLTGRLLFPRFLLNCTPYSISSSSHFVAIATIKATLSVYDTSLFKAVLFNVPFSHLVSDHTHLQKVSVTDNGLPVITTDEHVYCYNEDMQAWVELVSNSESSIIHSSKFSMSSTLTELTPLRSLQQSIGLANFSTKSHLSRASTLSYLESQIARSVCLKSMLECEHWIKCYVRYLVSESLEERLREFLLSLSGRVTLSQSPVGGVSALCTSSLLQDCLSLITANTKLQRLYCELRDCITVSK